MKLDFFEDFATVTDAKSFMRPASNITELWQTEEKRRLIQLWSMTAGADAPTFSDYDQFAALCSMMPMLVGHTAERHCKFFLKEYYDCTLPIDEEHCEEIWHMIAEELLHEPRSVADLFHSNRRGIKWLLWERELPSKPFPKGLVPMLSAKMLMEKTAPDWESWKHEADRVANDFSMLGCQRVYVCVPNGYTFSTPSLYAVERALTAKKRSFEDDCVLLSQTVRYLCALCIARGWKLFLSVDQNANESLALLEYCEKAVGLPSICWKTACVEAIDAMVAFSCRAHHSPCTPVFCASDYPSDAELRAALDAYAARYPLGLLQFASGGELIDSAAELSRLRDLLA